MKKMMNCNALLLLGAVASLGVGCAADGVNADTHAQTAVATDCEGLKSWVGNDWRLSFGAGEVIEHEGVRYQANQAVSYPNAECAPDNPTGWCSGWFTALGACGVDNGPVESCSDGVQNQDETGVDCGGSCEACPVAESCSDGVQNQDETGVDCGGSCEACDSPDGGVSIPALIEAEDFASYNDSTSSHSGDCGSGPVDQQSTSDAGGGCNVGWTTAGEWLEYEIQAANSGDFDLTLRLAAKSAGKNVQVSIDGGVVGTVASPGSGWQTWDDRSITGIPLSAGEHTVRVTFVDGSTNFNWLSFAEADESGESPSCSDGVQNQNEQGVDCGGPCAACEAPGSGDPGPGTSACDAGATVVNSLAALIPYLDDNNANVRLAPGTYRVDSGNVHDLFAGETLFSFTGDNSTYCFTGATIEFETEIFREFGRLAVSEMYVGGSNNHLKNLTMVDIGETAPYKTALGMQIDGEDNTIEGFHMTIRGSYPYAYGDMFGKGSDKVIGHNKHAAILLTGTDIHLKDISIIHRAYGHGIFMQGAIGVLIEGIYMEGELRTTDEVLAEVGTAAADVDFMTVWGFRVKPGYRFSLQEDGIRAYRNSANGRIAADITVRDSIVKFMRSGVGIGLGNKPQTVENVTSLGNESGFWTAGGDVIDCRGDASVGPLYSEDNPKSGSNVELTLLDHVVPRIGDTPLLYLAGSNHDVVLHDGTTMPTDDSLEIFIGGPRNGHRSNGEVTGASGIDLDNRTNYSVRDYQ